MDSTYLMFILFCMDEGIEPVSVFNPAGYENLITVYLYIHVTMFKRMLSLHFRASLTLFYLIWTDE